MIFRSRKKSFKPDTQRVEARARGRLKLVLGGVVLVYLIICGRLVQLATSPDEQVKARVDAEAALALHRPDILDRNGRLLAMDIETSSIFAEPKRMIDPDEAAEQLTSVLPRLDVDDLSRRFSSGKGFMWVQREVTPRERADVHRLGIPGIEFITEQRRIYPNANVVAHVLGAVNTDNEGIAGLEKYIDMSGALTAEGAKPSDPKKPITTSLDLSVQHAMRDELMAAMTKYNAIAASGAVMDANTGEMISLVSLPDFDPNIPADALKSDVINRINVGVYEMGSTFKALTLAMALDSGKVTLNDRFDARQALHYGRFRINDFHPERRILTVPEVFTYSSNIGTAKIALLMGVEAHKAFLRKMGQLDRLRTELPESAAPIVPARWGELNTVTISFGHGLSVAPLQTLMATGALVNGGKLMPPTFLRRSQQEADAISKQVIRPQTSAAIRYLMRLNAEVGSARKADVPGYSIGGKTGTAEKVINGRYSHDKVMTAFTAVFPSSAPRYVMLLVLDEPKGSAQTHGFRTSGWNVVPVAGKVVARIAPLLHVEPQFNVANVMPSLGR
jgi:cell division protein FtsI (penicillin-binding protein 3)